MYSFNEIATEKIRVVLHSRWPYIWDNMVNTAKLVSGKVCVCDVWVFNDSVASQKCMKPDKMFGSSIYFMESLSKYHHFKTPTNCTLFCSL